MFKTVTPTLLSMNKINEFRYYIGIDVSKKTLDISILESNIFILHEQIANTQKDFSAFLSKMNGLKINLKECLFCVENTGIYNVHVQKVSERFDLFLWVERAIQIKKSIGVVRGKNDKIDSYRIARYAEKNKLDAINWQPVRPVLLSIKKLSSQRRRLMSAQKQLNQVLNEGEFLSKEEKRILKSSSNLTLSALKKDILNIEKLILKLIKEDSELNRLYSLICSVAGIGMLTAIEILLTTNEFKNINQAKKFACYSGVVPFDYSSGTSIKRKPKVSKMANTTVKTLLHMAALSATRMPGDLKQYYERKVAEGKNKMSVINAIRNKLILRIFACVLKNRAYEEKYEFKFG